MIEKPNKKEHALTELFDKLNGLRWFALSGFAVHIYSGEKRGFGDIDLAVHADDIDILAKRLGCIAQRRLIDKQTFVVDDYGFETEFNGLKVEASSGYPKKRMDEGTFDKLFSKRKKFLHKGSEVYVCPVEELIVQKAWMHREKDIADLRLLMSQNLDISLVMELAEDWGKKEEILTLLSKLGFKIVKR